MTALENKWCEPEKHIMYDPTYGSVTLSEDQYNRARACVNACAGIANETLELVATEITTKSAFDGYIDTKLELIAVKQQNAELKEQSSRLAAEAVRQAQQNADLCVKNAELLNVIKWANNHGGLGYSIHGEFEKAIAKAGVK